MNFLIESVMVFLGTLVAAALVALGGPASVELVSQQAAPVPAEVHSMATGPAHTTQETTLPRR